MTRKIGTTTIRHLIDDERVRKTEVEQQILYCAQDIVAVLTDCANPREEWEMLKDVQPALRSQCLLVEVPGEEGPRDVLSLAGVLRLVQAIDSPAAVRMSNWLAEVAAQHVEEEADPELAMARVRQGYRAKGRSRQWVDQRLRCVSARNEVIGEWYKRGVKEADQFSALTNRLMEAAFGMDVSTYRKHKGIGQNLRDHLDDLELSLISLAETTAASLHRNRASHGFDELLRDVRDAGFIVRQTREKLEEAMKTALPGGMIAA
jgi:hypothetical protein